MKEKIEEEERSEERGQANKITDYLIQTETKNSVDALGLARLTDKTDMEETWDGKINMVCSTPKMTSMIGKEIQEEYRRNSLSKKRKFSQEMIKGKNQKVKPNLTNEHQETQTTVKDGEDHNFDSTKGEKDVEDKEVEIDSKIG